MKSMSKGTTLVAGSVTLCCHCSYLKFKMKCSFTCNMVIEEEQRGMVGEEEEETDYDLDDTRVNMYYNSI